jgi:hypothetical protein
MKAPDKVWCFISVATTHVSLETRFPEGKGPLFLFSSVDYVVVKAEGPECVKNTQMIPGS